MYLDPIMHTDYSKHIAPFIKNGVFVDTCVALEIVHGLVDTKVSKKKSSELDKIESVFDRFKLNKGLIITPHILTEICRHVRDEYDKKGANFAKVVEEIMPILKGVGEHAVKKDDFLGHINASNPVIEAGDLSIFAATKNFMDAGKKISVLSFDRGVVDRYKNDPNVMVINYRHVYLGLL